jgi:hypothetical protein
MAKSTSTRKTDSGPSVNEITRFSTSNAVVGVSGAGRWLLFEYRPTSLFSLKTSLATSAVGKSLVIPTPYSIKMAFVDASFRVGHSDADCAEILQGLISSDVRIRSTVYVCVTQTFVKIRQEPKTPRLYEPYIDTIAYRELVHCAGIWGWAFDLASLPQDIPDRLVKLAPCINYVGKRGSFIQYEEVFRVADLGPEYTQPLKPGEAWTLPKRVHIAVLDDFGPEADLTIMSSFSKNRAERGKHRVFTETIVPVGIVNSGPGFTEYGTS